MSGSKLNAHGDADSNVNMHICNKNMSESNAHTHTHTHTHTQPIRMYLEPIFASEDIMRQMPTEGRRFAVVDRLWKRVMAETKDNPSVMGLKESLLASFQETNQLLDKIQKGEGRGV